MSVNTDEPIGYQDITVKYREHGEYQYFVSFVVSFGYRGVPTNEADDPGIILARMWADGELIYDMATPTKAKPGLKWYVKYGHSDQMPIPGYELAYRDQLLVCFTDYPLGDSASIPTISAEFIDEQTYSVAGIMQSIALLAGYTEEQIETEGLSASLVLGYIIDGSATLETVATDLGFLYDFSTAENAGVITFAHKYEAGELVIDQIIPDGFLSPLQEGGDSRVDVVERSADQSLPSKISAQYFDVDANYETGNQLVQRNGGPIHTHSSTVDISISVPVVAEGADIRSRLYDALTRAWQERNGHSLRLPPMYMAMNPGNTLQWSNYGATYTGILVKTTLNADNSMTVSAIEKDADYLPAVIATQPPSTPVSWVGIDIVNTVIFDLVDTDEDQVADGFVNVRLAMGGVEPGAFHGARFELAPVGPLPAWTPVVTLSAAEEVMLAALAVTPADDATTLRIELRNMTADRLTAGIGENLAVGNGSTAEVVTYTGITPVGGDVYDLTGVDRGLFGSDLFINVHLVGEGVAFVDDMPIFTIPVSEFVAGTTYLYRTVPLGLPEYQADTFVFVPGGNSRKPYSPDNVDAIRDIGGDWVITWDEDLRFAGEPDSIYSIDIYNGDWSQVVRRVQVLNTETSGNTYTYYIEEQMIDGINELEYVNFLIYQINASHVGRGFPGGGAFGTVPANLEGTIQVDPIFTADLQIGNLVSLAGTLEVDPVFVADMEAPPTIINLEGTIEVDPVFTGEIEDTLPTDPYYYSVSLLMRFNEGDGATATVDSGQYGRTVTVPSNNPVLTDDIYTSAPSSSYHFDDASYYWEVDGHIDDSFGMGDFTIEGSFDLGSSPSGNRAGFGAWGGLIGDCNWYLFVVGGSLWFTIYDAGGSNLTLSSAGGVFSANTMHKVCVDRDGTKLRMYIDGVMVASTTTIWNMKTTFARRIQIGVIDGNPGFGSVHGIDDIRITKGIARYADDAGYTPAPFGGPPSPIELEGTIQVDPVFEADLEVTVNPPTIVDSTSAFRHSTSNGDMAINTPTTIANDIIVAIIFRGGATLESAPYTTPVESGWTAIDDDTTSAEGRYAAFWRVATGSEPSTYSFNQTGRTSGILVSIRGADTSAPIDAFASNQSSSAVASINAPSVTATGADDLLLCAAAFFTVGGNSSAGTITDPSGMTPLEFVNSSGTSNGTAASATALTLTASGATGTKSFGWAFSRLAIAASILIKP